MNEPQKAKLPTADDINNVIKALKIKTLKKAISHGEPRTTYGIIYCPWRGKLAVGSQEMVTEHVSVNTWIKNYRDMEIRQHEHEGTHQYAPIDVMMRDYKDGVYASELIDNTHTIFAKIHAGITYVAGVYNKTVSDIAKTHDAKEKLTEILYCTKDVLERVKYDLTMSDDSSVYDLDEIIHKAKSTKKELENYPSKK